MMDPIKTWLDPIEVRRLAERLMRNPREEVRVIADLGFGNSFIGFGTKDPVDTTSPFLALNPAALETIQATPAESSFKIGPPAVAEALPSPPSKPVGAHGPFLDRIIRFRDWMSHNFSATGIFILDRDGAVIFDDSTQGRLHFLARSLALASRRPGASGRNVHVKISAVSTLEVIPVETPYGCLVLGALVPESLSPASVMAVMNALSLVSARPAVE